MKKTSLKRGTSQLKRTAWVKKAPVSPYKPRRAPLRVAGTSSTAIIKREIQALLREIVIMRDKGCWLANYPEAGKCGGRRNDGTIIYQAEHLHTRANSASYADSRLVVGICLHHHIHWKPQHSAQYNQLARDFIGEKRSKLWDAVQNDHSPHKMDWKAEKLGLENELKKIKTQSLYTFNPGE